MPQISFDESGILGYLEEGVLRCSDGEWHIELYDGTIKPVLEVLSAYKNKEIRLSLVDLKEAEYYQDVLIREGQEDDDDGGERDSEG